MSQQGPVLVEKVSLNDGETVFDYIDKVYSALWHHRRSIDKSLHMVAIYETHVIAKDSETSRFYQLTIKRDGDVITLDGMQEVKMEFIPVKTEKNEDGYTPEYITPNIWRGIL